ncbi:Fe-S cluster assembly protein SufD [Polycladidibacter hongkongensis]|uniref:Fe-S cluster assembly protein SufD n=1 Tax=Polycladidibacter hongkongensis TaxID=1647556 RepID=UPI00082AA4AC|nr:Fe-S cluster assembly protein SufD [Pseudovibrio hongkongensis]
MTAQNQRVLSAAETGFEEAFAATHGKQSDGLGEARRAAMARFEATGLPHRRIEEYHYTDLKAKLRSAFALSAKAEIVAPGAVGEVETQGRLVFVNGRFDAALSNVEALAGKISVSAWAEEMGAEKAEVQAHGAAAFPRADALVDLNTAFVQGGATITVAGGEKLEKALEIVHVAKGEGASFSRIDLVVEAGADVLVLESYQGDSGAYLRNTLTTLEVGDNAKLTWVKLQEEAESATHLASATANLGKGAELSQFLLDAGSGLSRSQFAVAFNGEGSNAALRGVSLLKGDSHADITLSVDHKVPECNSREYFKAIVDDKARSVFQGQILVKPDAQKTDGQMMVQSLLLSESAEVNVKPELEIFADDVQCAHGSTTGEIDEDLLFYLRARGIPEKEARKILILAFLGEVIDELDDERVGPLLTSRISNWLHV